MKQNDKLVRVLTLCMIAVNSLLIPILFAYLYGKSFEIMFQLLAMAVIGSGLMILEICYEGRIGDNRLNKGIQSIYFPIFYSIVLLIACFYPLMEILAWPMLFIALTLFLFSNFRLSVLAYTLILTAACILKGAVLNEFALYFLCGIAVIFLFDKVDKTYKIGIPIFISICILVVSIVADIFLFEDITLNFEILFLPCVNIFVNIVMMVVILKIFSSLIVHKYRERYMTINDTEFILLIEIKKEQPKSYYRAIHTSYLTDKLARKFQLSIEKTKTASYYWKICEDLKDKARTAYLNRLQTECKFPPEAMQLIDELMDKKSRLQSREAVAVYMSNFMIERILKEFEKDKNAKIPYKQLFDTIFYEKLNQGFFEKCGFTMMELTQMKKAFLEEELYYDFLR